MSKLLFPTKDSRVTTVVATPGYSAGGGGAGSSATQDRQVEVQYTDTKVIGNGSFGVVYSAKLIEGNVMVAIKKVLQDKRFKVRPSYISCNLHCMTNAIRLDRYSFLLETRRDCFIVRVREYDF